MTAKSYFASEARGYDTRLRSGMLGILREAERRTVIYLLSPKKGEQILDIPCGSGYYADFLKKAGAEIYGIDISAEMITVFQEKKYHGQTGDMKSFSLARQFDKVLSAGGFEFCLDQEKIIKNLLAHTKEKGEIVVLFPRKSLFGQMYKLYHLLFHKTKIMLFSEEQIASWFQINGGKVRELKRAALFTSVMVVEKL